MAERTLTLVDAFTQPAVGAAVAAHLSSTDVLAAGDILYIVLGGQFAVTAVTDATHAALLNLGLIGSEPPGDVVPAGAVCLVNPKAPGLSGSSHVNVSASAASAAGLLCDTRTLGWSTDAFDRLRTCEVHTLFDYSSVMGKTPLRFDESVAGGGAASTWNPLSYVAMTVAGAGDSVVRQSKRYIPYQPGKSKLVIMTGVLCTTAAPAGVTARIGHFDAANGLFFQYASGVASVVQRSGSSDTVVAQSAWNTDKLDGSGASGYNVDWTKGMIFSMDIQWLGFGRVRMGIVVGGRFITAHQFVHAPSVGGADAIAVPYMRYAMLPIRYEISSVTAGAAGEMRMCCGAVLSEAGNEEFGLQFSAGQLTTPLSTSSTFVPVISLSLRTDVGTVPYNRVSTRLAELALINLANTSFVAWKLLKGATLGGTDASVPVNVDTDNSAATIRLHAATATVVAEGHVFRTGVLEARSSTVSLQSPAVAPLLTIGATIAGVPEVITLVVATVGATNASVLASFIWLENA